jgi:hypothetical protein
MVYQPPKLPDVRVATVNFDGGLDEVTPPMRARPGTLRQAKNFELDINGGVTTIQGYERFDGRPQPSDALYTMLYVTLLPAQTIAVNDVVVGATSTATGTVIVVAEGYVVLTKMTLNFVAGESLTVTAVPKATAVFDSEQGGAPTPLLDATYTNLAADLYRADITAVPGEGDVLGVFRYNSVTYAFRNNVGSTAAVMYQSSSGGWVLVDLGRELAFTSGGTYVPEEGDVITGATSGATATLTRVVVESGDWTTSDAAGRFIFASQTGTFVAENLNIGANLNVATIAGNSSAIVLDDSGRFKTYIYNFGGASGTRRVYGCDGVNRGWEFDGTVFVPISTGMDGTAIGDRPSNVWAHKFHLFFSFGSSAQHSAIGNPYAWTPVLGAAEIAVGDTITAFSTEMGSEAGAALGIMSRNTIHILYGSSEEDWQLVRYRDEIGAYPNSVQSIGQTVMLDDRGITSFRGSMDYGNFAGNTLSELIQPFINQRKSSVGDSCIVRGKSQYRCFFADGSAVYATFKSRKLVGMMSIELPDVVKCMVSVEGDNGADEMFFGSDNGFVYRLDRGTSCDGAPIEAYLLFHYLNFGTARLIKRWLGVAIEVQGSSYAEFSVGSEIGYASPYIVQQTMQEETENFINSVWDEFIWDSFYWDGVSISPKQFKLAGAAENLGLIIYSESDMFDPLKFSSGVFRYIPRRYLR